MASETSTKGDDLAPTHRCRVCGARWRLNPPSKVQPDGSWSLVGETCGKCCDNEPMGEQIERLPNTQRERVHWLKCWPQPFQAVRDGRKPFEFRKDDRGYEVGDTLRLQEWDPHERRFTGSEEDRRVTYIARGQFGIPDGYVVMGIADAPTAARGDVEALMATMQAFRLEDGALVMAEHGGLYVGSDVRTTLAMALKGATVSTPTPLPAVGTASGDLTERIDAMAKRLAAIPRAVWLEAVDDNDERVAYRAIAAQLVIEADSSLAVGTANAAGKTWPCEKCGKPRTKAEGGTTFTVCDACWDDNRAAMAKRLLAGERFDDVFEPADETNPAASEGKGESRG